MSPLLRGGWPGHSAISWCRKDHPPLWGGRRGSVIVRPETFAGLAGEIDFHALLCCPSEWKIELPLEAPMWWLRRIAHDPNILLQPTPVYIGRSVLFGGAFALPLKNPPHVIFGPLGCARSSARGLETLAIPCSGSCFGCLWDPLASGYWNQRGTPAWRPVQSSDRWSPRPPIT